MGQKQMNRTDQRGMASIIITMVTMVVISLIVIGFATISRREQRQSLDQLLSSQAFYAAESGVEDARAIIKGSLNTGQPIVGRTNCLTNDAGGNYPTGNQMVVGDGQYDVRYTCLKVDPAPPNVQFDNVSQNSIVVPVTSDQPITSIKVTWKPSTENSGSPMDGCPSAPANSFTPQTGWSCGHGVMRMDLVPTGGSMTSASLSGGLLSAFFVPVTGGSPGTLAYGGNTGKANVVAANCTATTACTATITGIAGGSNSVSLRINSMYKPSNLVIESFNGATSQKISGVQAMVDSTGRANDVLRRIQVRLPIVETGGNLPGSAITSNGSVCKRFEVAPGYFRIPGDIVQPDPGNDMCKPKTDGTISTGGCTTVNDIAFILDTSSSMLQNWGTSGGTRNSELRKLTKQFVQGSDIASNRNYAAVTSFNTEATANQTLTGNQGSLISAINGMSNGAGTNYMAGLDAGQQELNSARARAGVSKVAIFISDGSPNGSSGNDATPAEKNDIRNKANLMKGQGIRMFTIGIGDDTSGAYDPIDTQLLSDMAGNGGSYADARNTSQLQSVLDQISNSVSCN